MIDRDEGLDTSAKMGGMTETVDQNDIDVPARIAELMQSAVAALRRGDALLQMSLHEYRDAGTALTHARDLCEWGQWGVTLKAAGINQASACRYIRLATYWDHIPKDVIDGGVVYEGRGGGHRSGFKLALRSVEHMPKTRSAPSKRDAPEWLSLARIMKQQGASMSAIADMTGVSKSVVQRGLNRRSAAAARQYRIRTRTALRALARDEQRAERNNLSKSSSGELSKAYGDIRKLAASTDSAISSCPTEVGRQTLIEAQRLLVNVEDAIVSVMRDSRADHAAA